MTDQGDSPPPTTLLVPTEPDGDYRSITHGFVSHCPECGNVQLNLYANALYKVDADAPLGWSSSACDRRACGASTRPLGWEQQVAMSAAFKLGGLAAVEDMMWELVTGRARANRERLPEGS